MAESALDLALESVLRAIAARDLLRTLSCLASRHDPAVLGSEVGEAALGPAGIEGFFRRVYDASSPFRFAFPERHWAVDQDVAWVWADGTVIEPTATEGKPYRLTAVFVLEQEAWKLALWSGAEPVIAGRGSS